MIVSLVAGLGAYLFFHRTLKVGFWPAALVAWCYPLTGTYIVWQGCGAPPVICWLPWMLAAVDKTVRQPLSWGGPALAAVTGLTLISGQVDIGGQVLLTAGIYAIWCIVDAYGAPLILPRFSNSAGLGDYLLELPRCFLRYGREMFLRLCSRPVFGSVGATGLAWTLGILTSLWLVMPLIEYSHTGSRMAHRSQGEEERPPGSLAALAQVFVPDIYGSTLHGSWYLGSYAGSGNVPESAAGGYAGLLAALVLAPLAWCRRSRWSANMLWIIIAIISLAWCLNLPGFVWVLRRPGLNMMSHNRFVFATSFAILAMAATGLDVLWQREISPRWWFWPPMILLALLGLWCLFWVVFLPEPIASQLGQQAAKGMLYRGMHDASDVLLIQQSFRRAHLIAAVWAAVGLAAWGMLYMRAKLTAWHGWALGGLLFVEIVRFGYGFNAQCDPSLYYPRIGALESIAKSGPGRMIGYRCLPANLSMTHGVCDVRGYDGVDPQRYIELLQPTAIAESMTIPYARSQWATPKVGKDALGRIMLHPILDMLGVRYVLFRGDRPLVGFPGSPPSGVQPDFVANGGWAFSFQPDFKSTDYWGLINPRAMPRAFVPEHVETVVDDAARLQRLARPDFDPRQVAFVELPVGLPSQCRGEVTISAEDPLQSKLAVKMETPGLVVLADLWDSGWNAYMDNAAAAILRTNHALRGVVVPAGSHTLEFRYEPASLAWGLRLLGAAVLAWGAWCAGLIWMGIRRGTRPEQPSELRPDSAAGLATGKPSEGRRADEPRPRRRGRAKR